MIGDLNQLPPVMEEAALGFEIRSDLDQVVRDDSFYGYMWEQVPQTSRIMLPRQYRMREPIGRAVSDLFYEGKLIHEAPHARMPLPWPFDRELVWVDTGAQEEYRDAQRSVANEFEVALCKDITTIIRKRVRKAKLAVIAMYNSQVNRLVSALKGIVPPDDVESVDAFEGRESDGVILSLVRSNDRAAIGFLNDPNRVNVAISRAKKLLVIVGDSKTVIGGAPELFGPLFEHCQEEGLVAGVGAVVTACQRVGIRSQVQRLSKPKRGERRRNRRKKRGRELAGAVAPASEVATVVQMEDATEPDLADAEVVVEAPVEEIAESPVEVVVEGPADEVAELPVEPVEEAPRPTRRTTARTKAPAGEQPDESGERPAEATPRPRRRTVTRADEPGGALEVAPLDPPGNGSAEKPAPRRRRAAATAPEPPQEELPLDLPQAGS
jgi:hypothetical protein